MRWDGAFGEVAAVADAHSSCTTPTSAASARRSGEWELKKRPTTPIRRRMPSFSRSLNRHLG